MPLCFLYTQDYPVCLCFHPFASVSGGISLNASVPALLAVAKTKPVPCLDSAMLLFYQVLQGLSFPIQFHRTQF